MGSFARPTNPESFERGREAALRSLAEARAHQTFGPSACLWCDDPLTGRVATRKRPRLYCSVRCRTYYVRAQRRMEAQKRRPRCMICDGPLPYGKPGFNLSATTCSKECHIKRYNWYVRS